MAHTIKVKIYYEDTDAGGVVYYANYLRYMERARMEFLADNGIDIVRLHREGVVFMVVHVDISYKSPARLGDILDITTGIIEIKQASLKISHRVMREGTPIADAVVTLASVGPDGKPCRLPEKIKLLSNG